MNNNYDYNGMLLQSTHCSLKTRLVFMLALQQQNKFIFYFQVYGSANAFLQNWKNKNFIFQFIFYFLLWYKKNLQKSYKNCLISSSLVFLSNDIYCLWRLLLEIQRRWENRSIHLYLCINNMTVSVGHVLLCFQYYNTIKVLENLNFIFFHPLTSEI